MPVLSRVALRRVRTDFHEISADGPRTNPVPLPSLQPDMTDSERTLHFSGKVCGGRVMREFWGGDVLRAQLPLSSDDSKVVGGSSLVFAPGCQPAQHHKVVVLKQELSRQCDG